MAVFYKTVTQDPLESNIYYVIIPVVKHPKSQIPSPTPCIVQNDDNSQLRTHSVSKLIVTTCKYQSNEVTHTVDCYDNNDLARVLCKCSHRRETIPEASSRVPLSAIRFFGTASEGLQPPQIFRQFMSMYLAFFSHSPAADHTPQSEARSAQGLSPSSVETGPT